MKKAKVMMFALINMMVKSMKGKAKEKMIFAEYLPTGSKTFVQHNFPGLSIAYAEMKTAGSEMAYEVSLNDGTEVCFGQKGEWTMVDCKTEAVPEALMPAALTSFVGTHFNDTKVVRLNRTKSGFETLLSNGISLKFNQEGRVA